MTAPPLVSAIVPVHDGECFLREALESILQQDYRPLEVIVVDDGSTDESAAIAASLPVRVLRRERAGVAAARNTGLGSAAGSLIAFLDQDDLWPPGRLRRQVEHLCAHPGHAFVVGRMEVFLEPGVMPPAWIPRDQTAFLLGALVARRAAFETVGPFDERYEISSDSDWFAHAHDAGLARGVLDDVVLRYRIHARNASRDRDRLWHETMDVLKRSIGRRRKEARVDR
jgi:glycosyltransferase involved in cell wall biosynthesis